MTHGHTIELEYCDHCGLSRLAGSCLRFVTRLVLSSQPSTLLNHRAVQIVYNSEVHPFGDSIKMSRLEIALLLICLHTGYVYGKKMKSFSKIVKYDFIEGTCIHVCTHIRSLRHQSKRLGTYHI